jgi:hypothetical protein
VLFAKAKRKLATLFPEENVTDTQEDSSTANPQAVENSGAAHPQRAKSAADTVVKEKDTDLLSEYVKSPMSTGLKRKHSFSEEEEAAGAIPFDI